MKKELKELKNCKTIKVKREFINSDNKTLENILIEILENKIKNQLYIH